MPARKFSIHEPGVLGLGTKRPSKKAEISKFLIPREIQRKSTLLSILYEVFQNNRVRPTPQVKVTTIKRTMKAPKSDLVL